MSETTETHDARKRMPEKEDLLADIVSLLYSNILLPLNGSLIAAILLAIGLMSRISVLQVLIWLGVVVLAYAVRLGSYFFFKRKSQEYEARLWRNLLVASQLLAGIIWGSAGFVFFLDSDPFSQLFLTFVIGGMATGAVGTFSAFPIAVDVFVVPSLLPLVLRYFLIGGNDSFIMGVLVVVYGIALCLLSRQMNKSIRESLQLRHEKQGLVAFLRDAKEQAERANRGLHEAMLEANRQASMAKEANKTKSSFLANISHEMRTPLNHVIGLTNLVLDDEVTEEQRELLETSLKSAENLLTLMNDILDFSRLESKDLHLSKAETNMRGFLDEVVNSMRYKAEEKNLGITVETGKEVPPVIICDPMRLRQILVNLIDNAVKFTSQGHIDVSVHHDSHEGDEIVLLFSVVDTGIGVPEHLRESIFESFTQADGSSTRKHGGTGLGLAICRELVNLMGGRIWVEEADNGGAAFHFLIRAEKSDFLAEELEH